MTSLGYQTDDSAVIGYSSLSTEVLRRLSGLGIELAITLYPLEGKLLN